jgi:predicted AAA+ superfamily ATPase
VRKVNRIDIGLIRGVDRVRDILVENTERFAAGHAANNVLLWGARGMGKSSLVKAAHADVDARHGRLKLVEIHREDIDSLPEALISACTALTSEDLPMPRVPQSSTLLAA